MDTITLKVPKLLNKQLNDFAKSKGLNKSEIVRLALSQFLSSDNTIFKNSFMNLSEDLAGSVSGHADLSANPSYLEGYGK